MKVLSGQRAWLLQRITAVYVGLYVLLAVLVMTLWPPVDHAQWAGLITQPAVLLATLLFIFLLLLHAWIGLRDVILDYIRNVSLRLTVLSVSAFALLTLGFWALWILLGATLA
jgi:succinate dehydrogenase / fumarate reductase membrane anchor subunit